MVHWTSPRESAGLDQPEPSTDTKHEKGGWHLSPKVPATYCQSQSRKPQRICDLGRILLLQRLQDFAGRVLPWSARDPSSRVGSRSAQEETRNRGAISGASEDRPHREQLIERRFAVI